MPVQTQLQQRRGTAASWTSTNPTLAAGEIGFESDTGKFKIGNGSTAWASLAYATNGAAVSPLTTKGDLYTYSTADARLPVGANGETIVADSSTSTGLRYNPQNALVNPIINGGMDIWQRGTSIASGTVLGFGPDRFICGRNAWSSGVTFSRRDAADSNLPNIYYAMRIQRDSGNTNTGIIFVDTSVESLNAKPFAGKTITYSFYARAGANYSGGNVTGVLVTGTGTDQNLTGTGYTGSTTAITVTATLSTSWQRFVGTATLGTNINEFGTSLSWVPTGTAGANDWVEVTGFQIDLGTYTASTAPTFRRSGGTIQGELAACQRYYAKTYATGTSPGTATNLGCLTYKTAFTDSFQMFASWRTPVEMRTTPTVTLYSPNTGATGKIYTGAADVNGTASGYIASSGVSPFVNNVSIAASNLLVVHLVAEAEL